MIINVTDLPFYDCLLIYTNSTTGAKFEFKLHKYLLSINSDYFKGLFQFKDSLIYEIELDFSIETIKYVINSLYSSSIIKIEKDDRNFTEIIIANSFFLVNDFIMNEAIRLCLKNLFGPHPELLQIGKLMELDTLSKDHHLSVSETISSLYHHYRTKPKLLLEYFEDNSYLFYFDKLPNTSERVEKRVFKKHARVSIWINTSRKNISFDIEIKSELPITFWGQFNVEIITLTGITYNKQTLEATDPPPFKVNHNLVFRYRYSYKSKYKCAIFSGVIGIHYLSKKNII